MYNHSLRAYKIAYEALYKRLLNRVEDHNTEDHELVSTTSDIQDK